MRTRYIIIFIASIIVAIGLGTFFGRLSCPTTNKLVAPLLKKSNTVNPPSKQPAKPPKTSNKPVPVTCRDVKVPYERILTVQSAMMVTAENPDCTNWKIGDSYIRLVAKDPDNIEHGYRVPAITHESTKSEKEEYSLFLKMAKALRSGTQFRIEGAPSGTYLEPGMNQAWGSVWLQIEDGTCDIVVPVSRISILKVDPVPAK
jgi:hypothetical protein